MLAGRYKCCGNCAGTHTLIFVRYNCYIRKSIFKVRDDTNSVIQLFQKQGPLLNSFRNKEEFQCAVLAIEKEFVAGKVILEEPWVWSRSNNKTLKKRESWLGKAAKSNCNSLLHLELCTWSVSIALALHGLIFPASSLLPGTRSAQVEMVLPWIGGSAS